MSAFGPSSSTTKRPNPLYSYFFPAERGGITNDMQCWVVTRHAGRVLEWDIAHHVKAGLSPVGPFLDLKPGRRVALGHSMGHRYRIGETFADMTLPAEPVWIRDGIATRATGLLARFGNVGAVSGGVMEDPAACPTFR